MAEVEVRSVSKIYDEVWAVRQASFIVPAGSFTSILGPSGCGKTTTLRLIAGFSSTDEGQILIGSENINSLPPWQRNLGVVFQNYALFPFLNVRDNVSFGLKRRKMKPHEISTQVEKTLELVGLPNLERRFPKQLSGGQQQRVALARALVIQPKVLLLDEPLSNLDAKLRSEMRFELKRIQRETGVTTIFVTHDQEEALSLSDQIVVMNKGRVEILGTPRLIWEEPRNAFVADFLGVENLIPARISELVNQDAHAIVEGYDEPLVIDSKLVKKGEEIVIGIRSSDIDIKNSPKKSGENKISGVIIESTYLGGTIAYQIKTALHTSPLIASSRQALSVGTTVNLNLPAKCLMILNPNRLGDL